MYNLWLQCIRSNETNRLTNMHLAASKEYYCQPCGRTKSLFDRKDSLEFDEPGNRRRRLFCEACEKGININTESYHIRSTAP